MVKQYCDIDVPARVMLDVMQNRRYGVEYQPIIDALSGAVYGYEALARFIQEDGQALAPGAVFQTLHAAPLDLYRVEYDLKKLQITHAPKGHRLFVNIDPDAFGAYGGTEPFHPLTELFIAHPHVVVEVIENTGISDAHMSDAMVRVFQSHNIKLALDDIGASDTLVSLPILMAVDYLKLDRMWLDQYANPAYLAMLKGLIHYARETGKKTILEGIETNADLVTARQLGIDYVQGFLYRKYFKIKLYGAKSSASAARRTQIPLPVATERNTGQRAGLAPLPGRVSLGRANTL